ncbi:putative RNA-directed DNA polymerase from transposon X-element [Trichonephila clavipes]|nr:putative RNA-directed DNA polymerase from transposon X-element [Trichonephila clavipes]
MSVPSHPLKPFALAIGLNRLYEARSFNIKPFSERAKAVLNDAHLNHINIQENNIFAFPPWDIQIFNYHNPFSGYDKADTAAVIYQQLFSFHRNKYSKYIPVYTDGSKTAAHVGCGVIFNNTILSFSLHNSMSVFSAELTAILVALQHLIVSNHRHFCVYTDSMSALESLHFSTEHRHPTVIEILLLLRKLERKGFDVIFSWVPGHVGILGNEQADTAARSMSGHMQRPVCYRDLKTSTQNYIHRVWQETWDQQILNKLHNIHPSTSHWAALPIRRHDVRLTRLRIGHTRFTHRHLLLGENAPECPSCKVPYSVYHILIDCPIFNCHRITFFHTSVLTLSDLYASTHHGAQQGEAARRSSDMRQARHLPQRWYWGIVVQVREPVLETAELITSRLTGAGSLLPSVYGEAWAKGHATGTPDSTFPRYGSPHTANMRVRLKNQS